MGQDIDKTLWLTFLGATLYMYTVQWSIYNVQNGGLEVWRQKSGSEAKPRWGYWGLSQQKLKLFVNECPNFDVLEEKL